MDCNGGSQNLLPGRGAVGNPPNRFEPLELEPDGEWLDHQAAEEGPLRKAATRYYRDHSREVLSRNNSPDVAFDYSVNPYRGCEHGCAYCYARPTHEYLGFSAGLDFETRIIVKTDAPQLLERAFRSRKWKPQVVALSGNTDCYQPIERKLGLAEHFTNQLTQRGLSASATEFSVLSQILESVDQTEASASSARGQIDALLDGLSAEQLPCV